VRQQSPPRVASGQSDSQILRVLAGGCCCFVTAIDRTNILLQNSFAIDYKTKATMSGYSFPGKRVCCVITGASRGLGRELGKQFARLPVDHMDLLLTARTESDLKTLKDEIELETKARVVIVSGSLDNSGTLTAIEEQMKQLADSSVMDQVILIHNAGSLGDPRRLVVDQKIQVFDELEKYFSLNVTSFICLTSAFLTAFEKVVNKTIINISSLASLQAMKGMAVYSSGKAARDAVIRSIAHENPDVRCISYAPGPLETRMADELRANSYLKDFFENKLNLLTPETTVNKLIELLKKNEYENGAHVDFYDV
jgi:sepiapterin reductase